MEDDTSLIAYITPLLCREIFVLHPITIQSYLRRYQHQLFFPRVSAQLNGLLLKQKRESMINSKDASSFASLYAIF